MSARIFIVHDKPLLLKQAKKALEPPHHVTTTTGIDTAITILKEQEEAHLDAAPFELIMCCVHIDSPRNTLTAFDLLKWAKGNPQMKEIPFLLLCFQPGETAQYLMDSVRLAGSSLGASGYAALDHFEDKKFFELAESYLSKEYRTLSDTHDFEGISERFSPTGFEQEHGVPRLKRNPNF